MPEPHDLRSNPPLTHWHRLRRFFHLEGGLGVGTEIVAAAERYLLADSSANERPTAPELHVWESEGGASVNTER